jgi:uncharacterized protein YbgA (DUF1722 family)/uncharacterized protein YbbK (DUF523 family)
MKPRILVSKCLGFDACRYDGGIIKDDFIKRLKDYVDFEVVCPEVEMGLSVPRQAVRMIKQDDFKLVASLSGEDHTGLMKAYLDKKSKVLDQTTYHGAILKSRSPSCGIKDVKVYKSHGKVPCLEEKTAGMFGGFLTSHFPFLAVEDEGRLKNYNIREHFLTRVFTSFKYEEVKSSKKIKNLIEFHSDYKYLLMAYHQSLQKEMGRLIAHSKSIDETLEAYEILLYKALGKPLKPGRNVNMMMHIFGYFSDQLSREEKGFFLEQLDMYRKRKIPFSVLMNLLYIWVLRFDVDYLRRQVIFNPYPKDILDVTDSGKGIK